jgi:peptidoglycan/LPS O-acetylase OafA/YrhL
MDKNRHLDHIDFIKGLAAISVILLHTIPQSVLYGAFAVYHIWQAVPIFLFITFYLGFRNLEKKKVSYKSYYSIDRIR